MKCSLYPIILFNIVILFPSVISAQAGLKYAKLEFRNESFKFRYKMHAFLEDSLLVTIPLKSTKINKPINVPIDRIASIKIVQGVSSGKGALKGMLKGAILGLTLGLLFGLATDEPVGMYHQPSMSPIPYTIALFTPLATLVGLGAGARKYKTYMINGNLKSYRDQLPEIRKDLEINPHISISKFKELRNNTDHR